MSGDVIVDDLWNRKLGWKSKIENPKSKIQNLKKAWRSLHVSASVGRLKNVKIDFWITKQSTKNGQRKIKMIVVDHLIKHGLFGNNDSKRVFGLKLENQSINSRNPSIKVINNLTD
jgi:hypothetical protein